MADNEKLQLGLSLQVDLDAFEAEWKNKQAAIQKIINGHTFDVKIGGIQGLAEVQKEMERFARGVRASSKVDLVNTDSIKGLKDEIRALEITWSGLSETQKYSNKETGELTEFATSLAKRYGELTTQLKEYGLTLKETAKDQQKLAQAQQASFDSIRKDAYQSMGQKPFVMEQMAEYYRQLEESSLRAKELSDAEARRGEARFRESQRIQEAKARELQLQREEYEALRQQLREEAKLASMQKNRQDNERYTSQQRRISEGKRIQQILSSEAKTLDAINQRLAIQRQRLAQATIGSAKYKKIELDIASLEARLRSFSGAQQYNITTTNAQTAAFQRQSGVLNGLKQFMNAYVSILGAKRLVESIRDITAEFELQRVSLRAITQDAAFADSLFARIKTTSTESPFSTKDLVTYTKQLAAYRVENEKLFDTMNMLADVSAGLGVGMDRLILAYGQVKAASVLRGTELRQFTEAGIPMVDELARKFSQLRGEVVSTGEVFDLISTRQVPFEMVADIFKEMTIEGGRFYEMQKKQSESLYGVYENLKDNIQNAFDEIGQSNRGFLMGIGKLVTFGTKHLDILSKAILPLVVGMGAYRLATKMASQGTSGLAVSTNLLARAEARLAMINAQGNAERGRIYKLMIQARIANDKYTISVLKAAGATNVFSRAWYTLKAAIIANPIGAIITAVTALYSAITYVFDALGSAEKAQRRVTESMKDTKEELNTKFNLKGYDDLAKKLREQENLVKSAKMSYRDFAKVYPELAEQYKTREDRLKALNNVEKERQDIISKIKSDYPEYFSYLKEETSTVADLSKGYDALATKMREVQLERLKEQKQEAQKNIDWWTNVGDSWYASSIDKSWAAQRVKGLQEEIKAIDTAIAELEDKIEVSSNNLILWRQEFQKINKLLKDGVSDEDLSKMSFVESIEKTRNAWKKAGEEVVYYTDALKDAKDVDLIAHYINMRNIAQATKDAAESYAKFGNFSLTDDKRSQDTTVIDALKAEISLIEKIYKRYEDLRKIMTDDKAKAKIRDIYRGIIDIDFLSPSELKVRLNSILKRVKALGEQGESLGVELDLKIQDVNMEDVKAKLQESLDQISQQLKRQESASNFFEKILGITGNTELSTKLTLGITGVDINSGNSRQLFAQQLAEMLSNETIREEVKTELNLTGTVNATELEKAISTGEVSIARLQLLIEKMPKDIQPELREALSSFVDFNKKQTEELLALIPEFGDFNDKLNSLMEQRTAKEFKVLNMVKPPEIDEAEWKAIIDKALAAIQNEYDQEVGKLNFSNFQKVFADELSNLDAVTVDVIDKMIAELQGFLSKGELDPSQVKSITDLIDKLRNVEFDKQPVKEFGDAWKDLIEAIRKGDKEGKTAALSNLQKALESTQSKAQKVENALGGIIDVATGVADALGLSFSPETEEAIKAFKNGISIVTSALSAMLAVVILLEASLWPLLVVALALGALFAVFSWFSGAKVREANKEIERQEKLLKNLERAYKRLDEIQEGLVGNDWVRNQQQQIMNLSKQVEAFQAQLNAERSKGKSADEDAIEDYTDKILDAQKEMRDLRREIVEEMSGTNLADAARDFAQSWLDAYLSFDDTMGALKSSFKDMMKTMVQNSMLAKVVQKRLEPVFNAIDNAYADANLTPAEWQKILNMGNEAIDYLDEDLTHLAEMLDLRSQLGDTQVSDLTGIAKGVAQASEETVLTLAGYANSILYYQVWIKDDVAAIRAILEGKSAAVTPISGNESGFNVGQLISLQQQSLSQLQAINANTGNTVTQLQALNDKIDSVISAQGTSARKVVNTRLSN